MAGVGQTAMRLRRGVTIIRLLARDLVTMAIGHRTDDHRRSVARTASDVRSYVLALWSQMTGGREAAAERSERLLKAYPDLAWSLRMVSSSRSRHGELSASLDATRRLRRIADSKELRRRERDVVGRLRETDPGWLPTIVGLATAIEPSGPNVVMHLLKASLPDRQSGYTIRSRETLRAQIDAGLEPFAVTPFGYPPARLGSPTPTIEVVDGIRHVRLEPGAPTDGIATDELLDRTASLAAEVARRERPAIIQATSGHRGYEYALVGAALRANLHRPLVYEVRGFLEASWTADARVAEHAEDAELTRRRLATEMRAMTSADGITTIASAMRDELVARGVPSEKIVVVPNGVDATAFQPIEPDPALRAQYGLGDRWVFGYVSNMDHFREGHEVLIEATARLVGAGRPVVCLLVGDGLLRSRLEARVAAAGLERSIIFTGKVPYDRVRAHYALLDAFVVARVPDRAARFVTPLKPYEAMAMGLPLVVSDLPALTEIAAPDQRGLAFPSGDGAALAATLERLIDQPQLGADLAAAGRAWVLKERTWAANGARYRDLYAAILERFDARA